MQRTNYSSRYSHQEEDDEDYDEEQYTSDEPPESDYTDNTNRPRYGPQNIPRQSRPPPRPAQRGTSGGSSVSFFSGASNFEINGGSFTNISGNSYNGVSTPSWTGPSRPSAPRSKTTAKFFPNATGFKIHNGTFSNVDGDYYAGGAHNERYSQPQSPPRGPQYPSSYQAPTESNQGHESRRNRPARGRGTWARQSSNRDDNSSSFMQNAASFSSPTLSAQRPAPNFPSPQTNAGEALGFERTTHSHSAPPLSNNTVISEDIGDEIYVPMEPASASPVASQSAAAPPTSPAHNGTSPDVTAPAEATPPFPQFARTMAADIHDARLPNLVSVEGPIGNREEPVIQMAYMGANGAQVLESSTGPVATGQGDNSKPKFGKSWKLLNKGKGK